VRRTQPAARKQPAGSAGLSSSRAKNGTETIKSGTNAASTGGLIVYEKGKVIFQMTPAQKSHPSATEPATETSTSRQNENVEESDTSPASNPVPVSAETASAYLIHRIEPQYPTQAREQHIQGPVVLSAVVNKDGSVEVLKVVSGDPQLVSAAADAVRHWRFRPYRPHGEPVEFETQIKVNFALP
jgi:TonB family protein